MELGRTLRAVGSLLLLRVTVVSGEVESLDGWSSLVLDIRTEAVLHGAPGCPECISLADFYCPILPKGSQAYVTATVKSDPRR